MFQKASKVLIFFIFCISLSPFLSQEAFSASPLDYLQNKESGSAVEATADSLEYFKDEKKIVARGNVVVNYQASRLTADYAEIFTDTKKAYAEGHVTVYNEGGMLRGEKVF